MKKYKFLYLGLLFIGLGYLLYTQLITNGIDSNINLRQVDQNNTLINTPAKLNGKFLHRTRYNINIDGYQLLNNGEKSDISSFPLYNRNLTLRYKSVVKPKNILKKIKHSQFVQSNHQTLSNTPVNGTQIDDVNYSGKKIDRLRIETSSDGINWSTLPLDYPNKQIRDPSVYINNSNLFVMYSGGMLYTDDFKNWHPIDLVGADGTRNYWSPTIFKTKNNKKRILITQNNKTFYGSFKFNKNKIKPNYKELSVLGEENLQQVHIRWVNNKYLLTAISDNGDPIIATSNSLDQIFIKTQTNLLVKNRIYSSPQLIKVGKEMRLYFSMSDKKYRLGSGSYYMVASNKKLTKWGTVVKNNVNHVVHTFDILTDTGVKNEK